MANKSTYELQGMTHSVAAGLIGSLMVGLTGCISIAALIASQKLVYDQMGYYVLAITFLAAGLGAVIAAHKQKGKKTLICMVTGIVMYMTILCIGWLIFEGPIQGAGETLLLILGVTISISLVGTNRKRKPKRGYPRK